MANNKVDLRDSWIKGTRITEEDVQELLNLKGCCPFCKRGLLDD
jgi:hypothetical protein